MLGCDWWIRRRIRGRTRKRWRVNDGAGRQPAVKKQKTEDIRCGTVSFCLTEEQHKVLLTLEQTYPNWADPVTEMSSVHHGKKWASIENEMKARFVSITATRKTLMGICSHRKLKRELNRLRRSVEEREMGERQDATTIDDEQQQQEIRKLKNQVEQLERVNSVLRQEKDDGDKHCVVLQNILSMNKTEADCLKKKVEKKRVKIEALAEELGRVSSNARELRKMLSASLRQDGAGG
ncbi:unnamed protein product [Phytophthora fragariaefolia]|uniref:Unnamed protein product n=1 Tax=Phytophthora fragariaefolia TaxID=1490495 RepID=A0A9W6U2L8_9STRA|nr:unnamed protein product [Phytophthora fragariaefolia]